MGQICGHLFRPAVVLVLVLMFWAYRSSEVKTQYFQQASVFNFAQQFGESFFLFQHDHVTFRDTYFCVFLVLSLK